MAIALLTPLPAPPLATDSEAVFNSKADATLLAEKTFIEQMNSDTIPGINQAVTDTTAAKNAAAASAKAASDSASAAGQQVGLAADQKSLAISAREGAEAARDQARAYAQAAGSGIAPAPVANKFLGTDAAGNVLWKNAGQALGDVLITSLASAPAGYVLPNTVYLKSAYPELAAIVGSVGANLDYNGYVSSPANWAANAEVAKIVVGKDDVVIAVGYTSGNNLGWAYRSTDGGLTWSSVPMLTGAGVLASIETDGAGTWLAASGYGNNKTYRSVNNGLSWEEVAQHGLNAPRIYTDKKGLWVVHNQSTDTFKYSYDAGSSYAAGTLSRSVDRLFYNGNYWFRAYVGGFDMSDSVLNNYWRTVMVTPNVTPSLKFGGGVGVVIVYTQMYISKDYGLTWVEANGGNTAEMVYVDNDGIITARPNVNATGFLKMLTSYDFGESFVQNSVSGLPWVHLVVEPVKLSNGTVLVVSSQNSGTIFRSARQYNYDAATQFKTPAIKAPRNMRAYIKAAA